jgi:antitoxin component YwqK of YwqJK toxin-antitoxin module
MASELDIKTMAIILVGCCLLGCSRKDMVDFSLLEERDMGITYQKGEMEPFTGTAQKLYPNGKPEYQVIYVNGKAHGASIQWWENGQKSSVVEFQQGKIVSKKQWDVNGNLIN